MRNPSPAGSWTLTIGALAASLALASCGDGGTTTADTLDADTVVADTVVADTIVADSVVADTVVADTVVADTLEADTEGDTAVQQDSVAEDTNPSEDTTATDTAVQQDTVAPLPEVVINEVAPAGAPDDWIELANVGAETADLEGWLLRDDDPSHAYVFPAGTTLAPGAYLLIGRGATGFDFGLGGADAALLFAPGDALVDSTAWLDGDAPATTSWGRWPDGTGGFRACPVATFGAVNQGE